MIDWSVATPILAVLGTLLVGLGGVWLNNRTRIDSRVLADQKRTDERIAALEKALTEERADRVAERERDRAERRAERAEERRNRRVLEDYVYELRGAIAEAGGVPPDWPEGLDRA